MKNLENLNCQPTPFRFDPCIREDLQINYWQKPVLGLRPWCSIPLWEPFSQNPFKCQKMFLCSPLCVLRKMSQKCRVVSFRKWAFVSTHNYCCFNVCLNLVSRMRNTDSIIATVNKPQRNVLDMSGAFFWADLLSMTVVFTCSAKQNRHQTTERWNENEHHACLFPSRVRSFPTWFSLCLRCDWAQTCVEGGRSKHDGGYNGAWVMSPHTVPACWINSVWTCWFS